MNSTKNSNSGLYLQSVIVQINILLESFQHFSKVEKNGQNLHYWLLSVGK